ncbi:hypothetical protein YC2023_005969 [Brassica napus]
MWAAELVGHKSKIFKILMSFSHIHRYEVSILSNYVGFLVAHYPFFITLYINNHKNFLLFVNEETPSLITIHTTVRDPQELAPRNLTWINLICAQMFNA